MANYFNGFQLATFGDPVFLDIDYCETYKMTILDYVPLAVENLAYFGHTSVFFGIDPYTATVITPPSYDIAACAAKSSDPFIPYCANQSTQTSNG
jgi:hypothetical protein